MTWRDYWNGDSPIYVSDRHKQVHYRRIAEDIAGFLTTGRERVLDYGSGEALSADIVAARAGHLYLSDGAETVRRRIAERFGGLGNLTVLAPEDIGRIEPGSIDLVVVNSLLQYLSRGELAALLPVLRDTLRLDGRLLIADVIPPAVGPLTDASALLRFAARDGFLVAAVAGLVRTAFSDYRRKRAELGLTVYTEAEFLAALTAAGLEGARHRPNLGHNDARMAFLARRLA